MSKAAERNWMAEVEMARHTMATFGQELRAAREDRKVTLRKLAAELSINHVVIHRIEHGVLLPDEPTLTLLLGWVYPGRTGDGS